MIKLTVKLGDLVVNKETFDDLYALSIDLTTADQLYAATVLSELRDGAVKVSVPNAGFTDVYEVIE